MFINHFYFHFNIICIFLITLKCMKVVKVQTKVFLYISTIFEQTSSMFEHKFSSSNPSLGHDPVPCYFSLQGNVHIKMLFLF